MWTGARLALVLGVVGVLLVVGGETGASPGITERVSLSSAGDQATGDSGAWGRPAVSADGRYVAFESFATDLVSPDTNNASDIFVRDRDLWTTTRVSVKSDGGQATGFSFQPAISGDGRYVAFDSDAPDLVSSDGNNASDVFLRDRQMGATIRVSVDSGGGDADGPSFEPAISSDGRYVAFYSEATDLVSGDGNGYGDIFVRDRQMGTTGRVSVDSGGGQAMGGTSSAPAISADGRFAGFYSKATNLVPLDTNGRQDVFLHDRLSSPVGGIAVLPEAASDSGRPEIDRTLLAGVAAVVLVLGLVAAGAFFVGRRIGQG